MRVEGKAIDGFGSSVEIIARLVSRTRSHLLHLIDVKRLVDPGVSRFGAISSGGVEMVTHGSSISWIRVRFQTTKAMRQEEL